MAAKISVIAAVAKNGVIGADNKLPWNIPEDLRRFKKLTFGNPVIMGRKTFDSIGKPLPGRRNIVISRNADLQIDGCEIADSLEAAIKIAQKENTDEIFVIGGAQIYAQAMQFARRLYLTEIDKDVKGDAFFPQFSLSEWRERERQSGNGGADESQPRFDFVIYERTRANEN